MSIILSEQYPGKTAGNTTDYPYGEPRNITTPGDGTGTPWEAALVKDLEGFKQAALLAAGITPSGNPDTALASQMLQALQALFVADSDLSFTDADSGEFTIKIGTKTLIMKWGVAPSSTVGNQVTNSVAVTFPSAFPTACRLIITSALTPQGGCQIGHSARTRNGFNIMYANLSGGTKTLQGNWLAIGS